MKTFISAASALLLCCSIFAQREADWTVDLAGNAQEIVFHKATGIPVVVTNEQYIGIDIPTKSTKWTVPRAGTAKLSGVMEMASDYYEVPMSELAIINSSLINVGTGTTIIDKEKENLKNIVNYHFLPETRQMLIEAVSEGQNKLIAVNLPKNAIDWSVMIGKAALGEKLELKTKTDDILPAYPVESFPPTVTQDGQLLYRNGKDLVVLNAKSGEVLWTEKCKPANYLVDEKSKTVFIIERGGGMMSSMTGSTSLGNVIYAFDLATGKSNWKKAIKLDGNVRYLELWGDQLLVVDDAGMNFRNVSDGKTKWKKGFGEKRISAVTEIDEGLEVIFKSRKLQLIDPETGKKLWKKPQTIESEEEDDKEAENAEIDKSNEVDFTDFALYPTSDMDRTHIYYKNTRKWRSFQGKNIAIDQANNQLVSMLSSQGGVTIINTKDYKVKKKKVKLKNKKPLTQIKVVPNSGYFIYGQHDYGMVGFDGTINQEKAFKIPGEAGRKLLNLATRVGTVAATTTSITGAAETSYGVLGDAFTGDPKYDQMVNSGLNKYDRNDYIAETLGDTYIERFKAFKEDESAAYFFSKNKAGDKVLFKISKVDGSIMDELKFLDNTPQYEIDEISSVVYYAHKNKLYVFE